MKTENSTESKGKFAMKCDGCGVEKDTDILETYPYPEDFIDVSEPIKPIFVLDVCPEGITSGSSWRIAGVCHQCFHMLNPEMWIGQYQWESISPSTPFEKLQDVP